MMDCDDGSGEESECGVSVYSDKKVKKRKSHGRMTDVSKKLRLQSHFPGPDCQCKRLKCFENVPQQARSTILKQFNLMTSVDEQNAYLCGLISVQQVQNRRARKNEVDARFNEASYSFRVRFVDDTHKEIPVCFKAFKNIHGITKKKIEVLQKALKEKGIAPKDQRGKHFNRPRKLSDDKKIAVMNHIKSFKGRKGHYNLADSRKIYLPEELNINKMYSLYCEKHQNLKVSYETYRTIFSTEFNLAFGYPRKDTCSVCDEFQVKIKNLELEKSCLSETNNASELLRLQQTQKQLETENKLHKMKAETFYKRKKKSKLRCRKTAVEEAICFDFQKNVHVPNISTNDVYYKRQLSVFTFNVHTLSTGASVFYTYPETVGKKGSDDVCSMLHNYFYDHLDLNVRRVNLFCDSCGGQNKNFTVLRFLHYMVHQEKRFDEIIVCFPIRGHSYLETDKNMGLVNQKAKVELPEEWANVFRESRMKPMPFTVVEVDQPLFRKWTEHLKTQYTKKCPFKTRPVREIKIVHTHPRFIFYRNSYHGAFESAVATNRRNMRTMPDHLGENEFELPDLLYEGKKSYIFYKKPLVSLS